MRFRGDGVEREAIALRGRSAGSANMGGPAGSPWAVVAGFRHFRSFNMFTLSLGALLCGYLFFSKTFAYVHIPGVPAYIGEVALAVGAVEYLRPPTHTLRLLRASVELRVALLFFFVCAIRFGFDFTTYGLDAVRDFAMVYYLIFALFIVAAGMNEPGFVPQMLRWYRRVLPVFLLWAPIAILLGELAALSSIYIPGTDVPINSFKSGDYAVLAAMGIGFLWLGIDRVGSDRRSTWSTRRNVRVYHTDRSSVMLGLSIVGLMDILIAATQTRGGFVASAGTLLVVIGYLPPGRRRHLASSLTASMLVIISIVFLLDLKLPNPDREVSLETVADNVISIVERDDVQLSGTVEWREKLWRSVTDDMLRSGAWTTGLGFGPILGVIYGEEGGVDGPRPLRSVHNSHLTFLARTGVVGWGLWIAVWVMWFSRLHSWVRRSDLGLRDPNVAIVVWAIASAVGFLINAYFDPVIESPQGAIWLYAIFALGIVVTLRHPHRSQ